MPSCCTASLLQTLQGTTRVIFISFSNWMPTHISSNESYIARPTFEKWVQHLQVQYTQSLDWGGNSSSTSRAPITHNPAAREMEQHCLHHLHPAPTDTSFRYSNSTMTLLHTHTHTHTHMYPHLYYYLEPISYKSIHLGFTLWASPFGLLHPDQIT